MLKQLAEALPALVHDLRAAGFRIATAQYLDALDLLGHLYVNGPPPNTRTLAAAWCGVFSTEPREQERFAEVFDTWYAAHIERKPPTEKPSSDITPQLTWPKRVRSKAGPKVLAGVVLATLLVGAFVWWWSQPTIVGTRPKPPEEIAATQAPAPYSAATQPAAFQPMPRALPARPIPVPAFYARGHHALTLLWLIPVLAWGAWLATLIRHRFLVLRREHDESDRALTLEHLQVSPGQVSFFDAPSLAPLWRQLREFRPRLSKRMDIAASVRGVLASGGFFVPAYRQRHVPPAYLMLIDRRHHEDHGAALASEFLATLRAQHVGVVARHYNHDPRISRDSALEVGNHGLLAVDSLHPDHDLILYGDAAALASSAVDEPAAWTRVFGRWSRKWLLSPAPLWPHGAYYRLLAAAGFRTSPLSSEGLAQLAAPTTQLAIDGVHDLPLLRVFAQDPLYWIQEHGVQRDEARAAVAEVADQLEPDSLLLLAAIASYPQVRWQLSLALDQQLGLVAATREQRLRSLARLPWCQHAYFPDVIRIALFARLDQAAIDRIADAYHALFEIGTDTSLKLPVAVPERRGRSKASRQAADTAPPGTPLADLVLAAVIRGRRPGALEFAVPFDLLKRRVAQDWRALWLPLAVGALLVPASLWLNLWTWQHGLQAWWLDTANGAMRAASAPVAVTIRHVPALAAHAQALHALLQQQGIKEVRLVAESTRAVTDQKQQATDAPLPSNLRVAPGIERGVKENLASSLAYLTYSPAIAADDDASLPAQSATITLGKVPEIFQDRMLGSAGDMVAIPGGCFEMGSPSSEPERAEDEFQHKVCVEAFLLGRYEVTFAEYHRYAEAKGLEKPSDEGWGRGRRPVINVSWDEATAYAQWLSEETGEAYRLPTEAEWEYAARAGTKTAFSFGETIEPTQANYDGTVAYNGGKTGEYRKQSIEVGNFVANPFGLYDVHGNVWEWTCSAYDEKYAGGEQRCATGGDGGRVLRGGSWYIQPGGVAFRPPLQPRVWRALQLHRLSSGQGRTLDT